MQSKWKKLREGHWVSWNGYEIQKDAKAKSKWHLYDPDGAAVHVEGQCTWGSLRGAQRAHATVQSTGEALAARHIHTA